MEVSGADCLAQVGHQAADEAQVVERDQAQPGQLVGAQQIVQVGPGEPLRARRARAPIEDRLRRTPPAPLEQIDAPARAPGPGRAPPRDAPDASASRSRTCRSPGPRRRSGRRSRRSPADDAAGRAPGAPARPSSSRRPGASGPCPGRASRRSAMPSAREAATVWAETIRRSCSTPPWTIAYTACSARSVTIMPVQTALQPPMGALHRPGRVVAGHVKRRALVEDERDVRAERGLDRHRRLRPHEAHAPVQVGAEPHALLLNRQDAAAGLRPGAATPALDLVGDSAVTHREHLKPAGVGDDRPRPAHHLVETAELGDQLGARGQKQVKRVPQDHLVPKLGHVPRLQRLDRAARRQRDERRRLDVAVSEVERPPPGAGVRAAGGDLEHGDAP